MSKRSLSLLVGVLVVFAARAECTSRADKFVPVKKWHSSYLVVSNVGSSWIYEMAEDGAVRIYRPSSVDANEYPCSRQEQKSGHWCIAVGRLYRAGSRMIVKSSSGLNGKFYLNKDGKICAAANRESDFPGQCEDEGRKEAMSFFSVHPR